MRITTTRHGYEWIEQQGHGLKYEILSSGISSEELSVLILSSVLGYKGFQDHANCYCILSFYFLIPFIGGFLTLYTPLPVDLGPPFVNHASHYSSACPISHLPKPSVHCSNQDNTVQRSFSH